MVVEIARMLVAVAVAALPARVAGHVAAIPVMTVPRAIPAVAATAYVMAAGTGDDGDAVKG